MILLTSLFLIILFHEFGHFIAAKWCKCGVEVFSVGFGKPLFKKKIGKTVYQITPFLMGGYCQLQGEMKYSRSKYAFTNKRYSQKMLISYAGIIMNIITGTIALGLAHYFHSRELAIFAIYSVTIAISNGLPIPSLDGSYPMIFLFEKKWGKKKTYRVWGSICQKWFRWIMILNLAFLPYLIYMAFNRLLY